MSVIFLRYKIEKGLKAVYSQSRFQISPVSLDRYRAFVDQEMSYYFLKAMTFFNFFPNFVHLFSLIFLRANLYKCLLSLATADLVVLDFCVGFLSISPITSVDNVGGWGLSGR